MFGFLQAGWDPDAVDGDIDCRDECCDAPFDVGRFMPVGDQEGDAVDYDLWKELGPVERSQRRCVDKSNCWPAALLYRGALPGDSSFLDPE